MAISLLLNTVVTVIAIPVVMDFWTQRRTLYQLRRTLLKAHAQADMARTRYHHEFDHSITVADLAAGLALILLVLAFLNLASFLASLWAIGGMIVFSLANIALADHIQDLADRAWKPREIFYPVHLHS
ncbi:hypothetical protein [Schleiferilactobacillus harbinensis]|uniref:Uncharacterized protein n=1 Tax=Schleiferilactobacillus harbinensis TaxID=304207 RepID=A0A510TY65_9LACO|nr:hypothetical protein [Schleiferilactobacillus harbinensis]MCI1849271.1 hypothetical protein [Schleiferilactobacillus harbinensis]QEU47974.1 hypothetical protein FMM01_12015 [Schleiferilactobacillus harbinensis]QFR25006.1 hypothetical protein D1010_17350 [Schleiferilactobacillus harbinensis]GEK07218.1 hypothetical protein LHA01_24570 [Schleiferilactobacillus harbinensis]